MFELSGDLAERPILEVLRAVHAHGASGLLELDPSGHRRRLFFVNGELHLPGSHPLARKLGEQLATLRAAQATAMVGQEHLEPARRRLLDLIERIVGVVLEWRRGAYRFVGAPSALPEDLVGPLPTRRLLMVGATQGAAEAELLRRLGGESARLVAAPAEELIPRDLLGFAPEEAFLLERLRLPMSVAELGCEGPVSRTDLVRRLAQLVAVGLVTSAPERGVPAPVEAETEQDAAVVRRLGDRIARLLADEPLQLEPEAHRARLADLLARSGGLNHYEMLEVGTSASTEEVHAGYERVGRLAHPVNAPRLGLVGKEGALQLLFERATRAYVTLIDPERRRVYNLTELIDLAATPVSSSERKEERRQVARKSFERGIAYAAASEFHFAVEMLEQAVRADPRAEYHAALGRVQSRNPNWRQRAVESYRAAIELEPDNASVRYALGQLFEQAGDEDRARVQFAAVVRLEPHHLEAAERLAKLMEKRAGRPDGGGLFDRIFRRS
jgi:tetratricopeptide (TPR) repeat protein